MGEKIAFRWISVEERLPEMGQEVLVMAHLPENDKVYIPCCFSKRVEDKRYSDGNGFMKVYPLGGCVITHWFPIPNFLEE